MDQPTVIGQILRQRVQGRTDATRSAIRPPHSREVERHTSYNMIHDAGTTNPEQAQSAGDHSHGTPDGTISATIIIWASRDDEDPPIYVPVEWEGWLPLIRGSFRTWKLKVKPLTAYVRFQVFIPSVHLERHVDPGGLFFPEGGNNATGPVNAGEEDGGININEGTEAHIVLVQNGDGDDDTKARSVSLLLFGHRNKTYDLNLLPQLDPNNPTDDDLPTEPFEE